MSVTVWGINVERTHAGPGGVQYPDFIHRSDDPGDELNWCNANAQVVLRLLGLIGENQNVDWSYGEIPLAQARRALMQATARFARVAPQLTRGEVVVHGQPCTDTDGVVELRPVRMWAGGIDQDYLARQLRAWGETVEALAARGATHVCWG